MRAEIVPARTTTPSDFATLKSTTVIGWAEERTGGVAKSGKEKSSTFTAPSLVMSALNPVYLFDGMECDNINNINL